MEQRYKLDAVDKKILTLVQRNARLSHVELAEQVGASSASCWRRVKAMEAAGVLVGWVRLVDPAKIGRGVNVVCNVRVKSYSREASDAFELFVRENPEIIECYSMSGDWDFLLRVVATDVADYNSFLMEKLLRHPNVAAASSHFSLETIKYTTELPV